MKVLIIGVGLSPTGRSLWLRDHLLALGEEVKYRPLDFRAEEPKKSICVFDEYANLEARIMASNPDNLHWMLPEKEPPPDQRKGPKGPRNRWGKL